MDTNQIKKYICEQSPELKGNELVNSLLVSLVEIERILMRINEATKDKKIFVDVNVEDKIK